MKIGPLLGHELALLLVVDQRAEQVGRQQVGGELDALKADVEGARQRLHGERLGQARHAFDQQVAAHEQADQHPIDQVVLADDDLADLALDLAENQRVALDSLGQLSDIWLHGAGSLLRGPDSTARLPSRKCNRSANEGGRKSAPPRARRAGVRVSPRRVNANLA